MPAGNSAEKARCKSERGWGGSEAPRQGTLTDAVLDSAVEGVDDGRSSVGDPFGLIHRLPELSERVVEPELG